MTDGPDGHVMGDGLQHGPCLRGIVLLGVGLANGLDETESVDIRLIGQFAFRLPGTVDDDDLRNHVFDRLRHGSAGQVCHIADQEIFHHLVVHADHVELPFGHVDMVSLAILCGLIG